MTLDVDHSQWQSHLNRMQNLRRGNPSLYEPSTDIREFGESLYALYWSVWNL
ncbi:hypothetical protein GCM10009712_08310 [Pseudarthrobacter sulfonivorans]|uniref:hypothetical protein n=1 Tax=Pseudarthrobacter sulfonivorans TaxID=121292 RepID=UPI00168A9A7F|nr:hypothetical protein [Pseudarthrobacter sulfonivorans]